MPVTPRHADKHQAEKRTLLRMEFTTYCAAFIQMPCQIVRSGRRLIYRFLSWNPWQSVFLRLVDRLHGPRCVERTQPEVGVWMLRCTWATEKREERIA